MRLIHRISVLYDKSLEILNREGRLFLFTWILFWLGTKIFTIELQLLKVVFAPCIQLGIILFGSNLSWQIVGRNEFNQIQLLSLDFKLLLQQRFELR